MDVADKFSTVKSIKVILVYLTLILVITLVFVQGATAQNLLINGDFSKGTDNQPAGWMSQSWIDLPTTSFTWMPPSDGDPGKLEIANDKLNDSRWVQSTTLGPGLYYAGADISTEGVPQQSWAGALVSVGDQGVASMDVKGNSDWSQRGVFFTVTRPHTRVDIKLRIAGFKNFAVGRAYFRNAVLYKMDSAPKGALVLDLDADTRLWAGSPWTLVPIWVLLLVALMVGWRMVGDGAVIADKSPDRPKDSRSV